MRPVVGLLLDGSSGAVSFTFAVTFLTLFSEPVSAAAHGPEQIEGLIAAGAIALAIGTSLWAAALVGVAKKLRRQLNRLLATFRASIAARDALLTSSRDPVVVWNAGRERAWGYGGAERMVQSCLAGANSAALVEALALLNQNGTEFRLNVETDAGETVTLRGEPVGSMTAVWVESGRETQTDFRTVLDTVPVPVWVRDSSCLLRWGNRAFLSAIGRTNLETAITDQTSLERTERDLAVAARSERQPSEARRFVVVGGQRRALAMTHARLANGEIVGTAIDVTDLANAEARLQQHIDAHADTLDKLATAVAIFDRERRLAFYNGAYTRLWNLPESWLDSHPSDEEILDR